MIADQKTRATLRQGYRWKALALTFEGHPPIVEAMAVIDGPPVPERCPICWREDGGHWTFPHVHKSGRMVAVDRTRTTRTPRPQRTPKTPRTRRRATAPGGL